MYRGVDIGGKERLDSVLTKELDLKENPKDSCGSQAVHYPVMYREVLELLDLEGKEVVVDCTVGIGSHALKILSHLKKDSIFIGIDKDGDSLEIAKARLKQFEGKYILVKEDFRNLDKVLNDLSIEKAEAFFFDLGVSGYQLSCPERGFSFLKEGPLDMRMDRSAFLCAYDLVNNLSEQELCTIFEKFGQERFSRKIAHTLVRKRRKEPLSTTSQLKRIILEAVPRKSLKYRIHPATRVFQALRIAVNRELDSLTEGLNKAVRYLAKGGRIVVISFHSLEDRIVKSTFKNLASQGILRILTKKPLTPKEDELRENISSRSAKLRAAEKLL
jgi:16S rRNA (cytosine1402-N4)-methyltransferase